MSWLSDFFGGGGGEDPNAVNQRLAAQSAEATRIAQQQQQQQFDALMATLKPPEPAPVDPRIQQREDLRTGAMNTVNATWAPGFQNTLIPDSYDDELANAVYGEQRSKADNYIQNLLKRGVITDAGAGAASKNLDEQGARVRTQLKDVGQGLLDAERGKIGGIYGQAKDAASTVDIGQSFDPNAFTKLIGDNVSEFNNTFGDSFRAGIPGDLFDTSALSSIAGGAQGAGNTAFDPNAVSAGVIGSSETEDDPNKPKTPQRTTSVF
jgi:hypothetical protein